MGTCILRSHFIVLNIDIIYYKWYNLINNVARGVFMSTANDKFQLMLKQIDMETQIVEYQEFISGNYSLKKAEQELYDIAGNVNALVNLFKSSKPQQVFDASAKTDELQKLLKQGKLKFGKLKDGTGLMPSLYTTEEVTIGDQTFKKGKMVSQVRLNIKDITPDMAQAINNVVVNQQLTRINAKLDEMNNNLGNIEQGQRNDRIGLVSSAVQLMKEALATKDETLKKLLIANAVSTANNARFQLMETLKTDRRNFINQIESKNILDKIKDNTKEIDNTMDKMRTAFYYINMSTSVSAQGYMFLEEKNAVLESICSYKDFINDIFIKDDFMEELQSYDDKSDNMWLEKPKEIYETLDDFTINLSDNLSFLDHNENIELGDTSND